MTPPLLRQVQRFLRHSQLLPPHSRLLVAVSGGQDSLCLLDVLHRLRPRWHWELGVAHCDHGWRADSLQNADYVRQLAQQYGYPYYLAQAQHLPQQEAAARQWRYQALVALAQQHHYPLIATGHTASDRVETFLFHLCRGSGISGLVALAPSRPLTPHIRLVRPLWTVRRAETAAYCQQQGLTVWVDASNAALHYRRNRIRQELLPYLQTHFNPRIEAQLLQTLDILTAEQRVWQAWVQRLWPQVYDPTQHKLQRRQVARYPLALQRHLLRVFLQRHVPRAVSFIHIEQVRRLLTMPTGAKTASLPGGWQAEVRGDWLYLSPASPAPASPPTPPPPGFAPG
ncbi:tRNA lysidine(34) synthetase TilS [Gloeomargarita sp.]